MAFGDRLVDIMIRGEDDRDDHGEHVPGEVTTYRRWCVQRGSGSVDVDTQGGVATVSARTFTVRFFAALTLPAINSVSITDSDGIVWSVTNIVEGDARKRFYDIETTREVLVD